MTVLASTLKGEYLSSITGSIYPAIQIPVKFTNYYPVLQGARVLFVTFLQFPSNSPFLWYNPTGPLAFYQEVGQSGSRDWVMCHHRAWSRLVVFILSCIPVSRLPAHYSGYTCRFLQSCQPEGHGVQSKPKNLHNKSLSR